MFIIISEYIKTVMTVALCAFLCESISGSITKSKTSQKGLKLITDLCILAVILSPFFKLSYILNLNTENNKREGFEIEQNLKFEELTEQEFEKQVKSQIEKQAGVSVKALNADLEFHDNSAKIKCIYVKVSNQGDTDVINKFIDENIGKEIAREITVINDE